MTEPFEEPQAFESGKEAHELAALLRLAENGWPAAVVCKTLKMTSAQYTLERRMALEDEAEAKRTGAVIWKGKVS